MGALCTLQQAAPALQARLRSLRQIGRQIGEYGVIHDWLQRKKSGNGYGWRQTNGSLRSNGMDTELGEQGSIGFGFWIARGQQLFAVENGVGAGDKT